MAHQARAYPGFCSMKRSGVFLLSPGWDASPSEGYPPSIKFAGIKFNLYTSIKFNLYTWVERDHVSYGGPPPMHRSIYQSIQRSILDRVSTDVSTDTPIGRYTWWFTDTSPIPHWYFTDTAPMLHRYFSSYIGRHLTESRAVDKCSSIGRCICRYIGRYIGR